MVAVAESLVKKKLNSVRLMKFRYDLMQKLLAINESTRDGWMNNL